MCREREQRTVDEPRAESVQVRGEVAASAAWMLIVRKAKFVGAEVLDRGYEHAVVINDAESVVRVDQEVPVLQVPVGNAGAMQIFDAGSELVRHVKNPIRMAEVLFQPGDERLGLLNPFHAEDRVPLSVDQY